jgi:hypothetical protein
LRRLPLIVTTLNATFYPSSLFLRASYFVRLRRPRCFRETSSQPLAAAQNPSDLRLHGGHRQARALQGSISLLAQ